MVTVLHYNCFNRFVREKNKKTNNLVFDFMMRFPPLVVASIMRQCVNVTVMIRVQVAASGNVLEELALHAPLLVEAIVIGTRVDSAIVI